LQNVNVSLTWKRTLTEKTMKKTNKIFTLLILAFMLIGLSLSGCRSRELCPAYTDSSPVMELPAKDLS
jgi:hypothetical protein